MVVDALLPSKKSDVAFDDRKMELDEKIISKNLRDQHKTFKIPLTTYLTPYAVVQRRLLTYDREAHLMPSIYTYYKQVRLVQYEHYHAITGPSLRKFVHTLGSGDMSRGVVGFRLEVD